MDEGQNVRIRESGEEGDVGGTTKDYITTGKGTLAHDETASATSGSAKSGAGRSTRSSADGPPLSAVHMSSSGTEINGRGTPTGSGEGSESRPGSQALSERYDTPVNIKVIHDSDQDSDSGWDTDLEIEEDSKETYDATGRRAYIQACKDLGVVPVSHFLRHITTNKISMKHHGLGPQGAKAIAIPLVTNTTVLTLDLEDNWIEGEGAGYISEMMKENCYISDLNLAGNKMRSKGAKVVGEMLNDNTSIRKINVAGNDFKDRDAQPFADAIKNNYRIKELDLSHNEFAEIGGEIMGQGIAATESVSNLNLSWNHLRRNGAISICRGMAENLSIKRLDVSWNGFANDGALAMAEALKFNSSLQWLDISNNRIADEGALLLSKGLEVNDSLQILRLGMNPITAAGAMALLVAINNNSNTALDELDLTDIVVNKDFVDLLEQIKQGRSNFLVFYKGAIGKFEKPAEKEVDPLKLLVQHIEKNNLRIWDLFKAYDKDNSLTVTREEFKNGIMGSNIPLTPRQIDKLVVTLDRDGDGEIDYRWIAEVTGFELPS
ncbi:leucine-rich repeat-containing protein 74A-like isoform X2 [Patiria miniata]|uniref:EF-hand domain-containing protein n=1 Tax=Patiria miniata TaxID=46514 RepID=A0A914BGV8_PATMI|nr:leucine-rich repeat-containing protein 74A-like isoform X2 [Patiria miniata]